MSGLDPVSPYLALIDRIISLVQARKIRRRDYFEKIIDPLYAQFIPLGEDTLSLFRTARIVGNLPQKKRVAKFEELRKKREQFVDARKRLQALLEACEKSPYRMNT
jgi:hypothetical protein